MHQDPLLVSAKCVVWNWGQGSLPMASHYQDCYHQAWGQIRICIWFLSESAFELYGNKSVFVFVFDWKWCICIWIFGKKCIWPQPWLPLQYLYWITEIKHISNINRDNVNNRAHPLQINILHIQIKSPYSYGYACEQYQYWLFSIELMAWGPPNPPNGQGYPQSLLAWSLQQIARPISKQVVIGPWREWWQNF